MATLTGVLLCPVVLQILDETSAAVAALEAQQWRASTERSLEYARSLGAKAAVTLQVGTHLRLNQILTLYKQACGAKAA